MSMENWDYRFIEGAFESSTSSTDGSTLDSYLVDRDNCIMHWNVSSLALQYPGAYLSSGVYHRA